LLSNTHEHPSQWRTWLEGPNPFSMPMPACWLELHPATSPLCRLLILRAAAPHQLPGGMASFVADVLPDLSALQGGSTATPHTSTAVLHTAADVDSDTGADDLLARPDLKAPAAGDLSDVYLDMAPSVPALILLAPGADGTGEVIRLAEATGARPRPSQLNAGTDTAAGSAQRGEHDSARSSATASPHVESAEAALGAVSTMRPASSGFGQPLPPLVQLSLRDRLHVLPGGVAAEETITAAVLQGDWVLLQDCHLAATWMPRLAQLVRALAERPVRDLSGERAPSALSAGAMGRTSAASAEGPPDGRGTATSRASSLEAPPSPRRWQRTTTAAGAAGVGLTISLPGLGATGGLHSLTRQGMHHPISGAPAAASRPRETGAEAGKAHSLVDITSALPSLVHPDFRLFICCSPLPELSQSGLAAACVKFSCELPRDPTDTYRRLLSVRVGSHIDRSVLEATPLALGAAAVANGWLPPNPYGVKTGSLRRPSTSLSSVRPPSSVPMSRRPGTGAASILSIGAHGGAVGNVAAPLRQASGFMADAGGGFGLSTRRPAASAGRFRGAVISSETTGALPTEVKGVRPSTSGALPQGSAPHGESSGLPPASAVVRDSRSRSHSSADGAGAPVLYVPVITLALAAAVCSLHAALLRRSMQAADGGEAESGALFGPIADADHQAALAALVSLLDCLWSGRTARPAESGPASSPSLVLPEPEMSMAVATEVVGGLLLADPSQCMDAAQLAVLDQPGERPLGVLSAAAAHPAFQRSLHQCLARVYAARASGRVAQQALVALIGVAIRSSMRRVGEELLSAAATIVLRGVPVHAADVCGHPSVEAAVPAAQASTLLRRLLCMETSIDANLAAPAAGPRTLAPADDADARERRARARALLGDLARCRSIHMRLPRSGRGATVPPAAPRDAAAGSSARRGSAEAAAVEVQAQPTARGRAGVVMPALKLPAQPVLPPDEAPGVAVLHAAPARRRGRRDSLMDRTVQSQEAVSKLAVLQGGTGHIMGSRVRQPEADSSAAEGDAISALRARVLATVSLLLENLPANLPELPLTATGAGAGSTTDAAVTSLRPAPPRGPPPAAPAASLSKAGVPVTARYSTGGFSARPVQAGRGRAGLSSSSSRRQTVDGVLEAAAKSLTAAPLLAAQPVTGGSASARVVREAMEIDPFRRVLQHECRACNATLTVIRDSLLPLHALLQSANRSAADMGDEARLVFEALAASTVPMSWASGITSPTSGFPVPSLDFWFDTLLLNVTFFGEWCAGVTAADARNAASRVRLASSRGSSAASGRRGDSAERGRADRWHIPEGTAPPEVYLPPAFNLSSFADPAGLVAAVQECFACVSGTSAHAVALRTEVLAPHEETALLAVVAAERQSLVSSRTPTHSVTATGIAAGSTSSEHEGTARTLGVDASLAGFPSATGLAADANLPGHGHGSAARSAWPHSRYPSHILVYGLRMLGAVWDEDAQAAVALRRGLHPESGSNVSTPAAELPVLRLVAEAVPADALPQQQEDVCGPNVRDWLLARLDTTASLTYGFPLVASRACPTGVGPSDAPLLIACLPISLHPTSEAADDSSADVTAFAVSGARIVCDTTGE